MSWMNDEQYREVVQQLDALVQEFESLPYPQIRNRALELLQTIDLLHREPLTRLITLLRERGNDQLVHLAAQDPVVCTLLTLYDLAPEETRDRLETGGSFIPVQEITAVSETVPLNEVDLLPPGAKNRARFQSIAPLDAIPPGTMQDFEVEGKRVLVANIDGELYAVSATCPGSAAPLHLGRFSPPVVLCPWHNEAFDIRSGRRADGSEGENLTVFPVKAVNGEIQLVTQF